MWSDLINLALNLSIFAFYKFECKFAKFTGLARVKPSQDISLHTAMRYTLLFHVGTDAKRLATYLIRSRLAYWP